MSEDKKLPDWFPNDPYPLKLGKIKSDEGCMEATKDPKKKESVAWFLSGRAFRLALKMVNEAFLEKEEERWFTTDKPLPDGDYGWRFNKENKIYLVVVAKGLIYGTDDSPGFLYCDSCKKQKWIHTTLEPTIWNKGEFCKIEFPT